MASGVLSSLVVVHEANIQFALPCGTLSRLVGLCHWPSSTDLVTYRRKRTQALQQMKLQGYRSRADAEETELAARYNRYDRKANGLSKKLKTQGFRRNYLA